MKKFLSRYIWVLVIPFAGVGFLVGKWLAKTVLPSLGANMIRPGDIIGCYIGAIIVSVIVAIFVISWIETKFL